MEDSTYLLSTSQIAKIADVGMSAVCNWKTRHEDFPIISGYSGNYPLYKYEDVVNFLERHNK